MGASRPGRAAGEVQEPAAGDGDHQAADPQVGARRGFGVAVLRLRRTPHQQDAAGQEGDGHEQAAPPDDRADPRVEAAAHGTRRVGVHAHARHETDRDAQEAREVGGVTTEGRGQPADQPVDEGRRRRCGLPLRWRALGPPAAGTLGRSHSAHNRTSSPTCNSGNRRRRRSRTRRARPMQQIEPSHHTFTNVCGRFRSHSGRNRPQTLEVQRRGWQVGQWVVPRGVDHAARELGAAAAARLAGSPVAAELELVAAGLVVDVAVVTQCGAAVGDALLEDVPQLDEQRIGLPPGDRAPSGVDTRPPEGLVGVDVADTGEGALREQLRLDAHVAALQVAPQPAIVEDGVPRLGPLGGEGGQRGVLPHRDDTDATEAAHVAQLEHAAVVERPPGPHIRVELARPEPQLPGHAEVDDQLSFVVEPEQQVLAAAARRPDGGAGCERRRRELGRRVPPPLGDPPPHHHRLELAAHGLDLGQLGHPSSMPAAAASQAGVATAVAVAVTVVPSDAPGIALAKT